MRRIIDEAEKRQKEKYAFLLSAFDLRLNGGYLQLNWIRTFILSNM